MHRILISLILIFFGMNVWSFESSPNDKYSVSFNYLLNMNTQGNNSTTAINLSVSPSLIRNDIHEFGSTLSYSDNSVKNSFYSTSSTSNTTSISGFYRFNIPIGDASSKSPLIGYIGPQVGMVSIKNPAGTSSNTSAGGQVGLNMMVAQNVAINFHVFQFDTVFASETQLLLTQSVGIKYYF